MSDPQLSQRARPADRGGWWVFGLSFVAVFAILALTPGAVDLDVWSRLQLKAPDLAPLLAQSALVQFHVWTVALALVLGPVQFALPKGTRTHRVIGWIWATAMFATAIATFFIRDMNDGAFSPIHIFSVMTFVGVPSAIWLARKGYIVQHTRAMIGMYIGLIIAGVTAIAPGRLIWEMFFR